MLAMIAIKRKKHRSMVTVMEILLLTGVKSIITVRDVHNGCGKRKQVQSIAFSIFLTIPP